MVQRTREKCLISVKADTWPVATRRHLQHRSVMGMPFISGQSRVRAIVYPTAVKWCSAPTKIALDGDVLLSVRAPVGPTNMANRDKLHWPMALTALRAREEVLPKYVLYWNTGYEPINWPVEATGSTFAAISGAVVETTSCRFHRSTSSGPS